MLLWLPRDKKILLSCYVGHFSSAACIILREIGYDAYSLDWGLAGWNRKGVPEIADLLARDVALPVIKGPGPSVYDL